MNVVTNKTQSTEKPYESKKKKASKRKQNESNKEINQFERKQKRKKT